MKDYLKIAKELGIQEINYDMYSNKIKMAYDKSLYLFLNHISNKSRNNLTYKILQFSVNFPNSIEFEFVGAFEKFIDDFCVWKLKRNLGKL